LNWLYYGNNIEDDWNVIHKKSYYDIEYAGWINKGIKDNYIIYLHAINKEVTVHNNKKVMKVSNLIVLVKAENIGRGKLIREDSFRNLASKMHLHIGLKALLIRN